jgi:hypothetical protein
MSVKALAATRKTSCSNIFVVRLLYKIQCFTGTDVHDEDKDPRMQQKLSSSIKEPAKEDGCCQAS